MALIGSGAVLTSQVAVTNSTADTTILSTVVPANGVAAGSHFRFEAAGSISIPAANEMLTLWIAVNGTKIATVVGRTYDIVGGANVAESGLAWHANGGLTIRSLGASGSAIAMLRGLFFAGPTGSQALQIIQVPSAASALNTTAAMTPSIGMALPYVDGTSATADHAVIQQVA